MSIKGSWQRPEGDRKKFDEEYDRIFSKNKDTEGHSIAEALQDAVTHGVGYIGVDWGKEDSYAFMEHIPIKTIMKEFNIQEDLGDVNDRIFNKKREDVADALSLALHDMYKGGETPEMYYEVATNEQGDLGNVNDTDE
jgi:hypothetical protein